MSRLGQLQGMSNKRPVGGPAGGKVTVQKKGFPQSYANNSDDEYDEDFD